MRGMSYKYQARKAGEGKYVLPRSGNMRCEVVAFLDDDLFASSEEELWSDAVTSASLPGAIGMYLMPDTHKGYVLPIGGVLITEGVIAQAGSGYDISCGVQHLQLEGLHARDIQDFDLRSRWVDEVNQNIAMGMGMRSSLHGRKIDIEEVFRYGAKAIGGDLTLCERPYIPIPEGWDSSLIPNATNRAAPQIGTVGGGNHFIELQVDTSGGVWVMVHCGSRGFGWQTANYFFHEGAKLRGLPSSRREESWLRVDEPLGQAYWHWHNAAANYAIANRHLLTEVVSMISEKILGGRAKPFFEISHNLVQEETVILPDGTHKRGFVHRKGSTRAFPAGHPDLVGTRWEKTGHPCLIPGSMLTGAAILQPLPGAVHSGCSVNHGSGRSLGRNKAKTLLGSLQADINREMRERQIVVDGVEMIGIASNCENIPLDECGHVYKDLDKVLAVLESEQIATLTHRLYPVANLKSSDS